MSSHYINVQGYDTTTKASVKFPFYIKQDNFFLRVSNLGGISVIRITNLKLKQLFYISVKRVSVTWYKQEKDAALIL